MSKYEQLIEYIINDEEEKARELFHNIVVEKSREIYESLIDEEDLAEVGGNEVEDLVDEISSDEEGVEEAAEEDSEESMEAAEEDSEEDAEEDSEEEDGEMDLDGDMEVGADAEADMGGDEEPATKGDIMNIETALADLQAKFDELMADEMNEPEHADLGMDDGMPGDDMGADEGDEMAEMGAMPSMSSMPTMEAKDKAKKEEMLKDKKDAKKDAKKDDKKSAKKKMTESEWLREYVDKIGDIYSQEPAQGEGHEVGDGGKAKVDTKSIVAGKNDMGGTAKNLNQGDKGEDPDGKQTPKPNNEYTKGEGNLPGAGKFKNVPGAKGDSFKAKAPAAKSGEEGATNKKSPLAK